MTGLPAMFSRTGLALSIVVAGAAAETWALSGVGSTYGVAAPPVVQRPTPLLVEPTLGPNYAPPLTMAGQVVQLAPLNPAVTEASALDYNRLHYLELSDLGGFSPAPPGQLINIVSGRTLGANGTQAQIPLYAQAAHGAVSAFAFVSGSPGGGGNPVVVPGGGAAGNGNGNGNNANGNGNNGNANNGNGNPAVFPPITLPPTTTTQPRTPGSTTTVPSPNPAPSTTTTTPSPSPTTTAPAPTTTTTTSPPGPQFLALTNNHNGHSLINAVNMAPGESASQTVILTNTGTIPFTLYVLPQNAGGALAPLLTLTIAATSNGQVFYNGSLFGSQARVAFLTPGEAITCTVTLSIPANAGNNIQNESGSVDLIWGAQP